MVFVLSISGDQIPDIPSVEIVGNGCNGVSKQMLLICVKIGGVGVLIVTNEGDLELSTPFTV